ncbi:hypothetical protein [Actinophytocola glycyrrhizae]|uniref:Uncharacterized protein n=1 Tax=Actinophytocola glycyrrhizae TaxID=2044873 RepID=A0ABV9RZD2_9PSEU
MCVDKKLSGVAAVQTLFRFNRTHRTTGGEQKRKTFVIDTLYDFMSQIIDYGDPYMEMLSIFCGCCPSGVSCGRVAGAYRCQCSWRGVGVSRGSCCDRGVNGCGCACDGRRFQRSRKSIVSRTRSGGTTEAVDCFGDTSANATNE